MKNSKWVRERERERERKRGREMSDYGIMVGLSIWYTQPRREWKRE